MHYAPLITAATTSSLANILNSKNRRGAACADFAEENQKSRFWAEAAQRDDRLRLQKSMDDPLSAPDIKRETQSASYSGGSSDIILNYLELYKAAEGGESKDRLVYESCRSTEEYIKEFYPDGQKKISATPARYQEWDINGNPYKGEFAVGYENSSAIEHRCVMDEGKIIEYHHYTRKGREDTKPYLAKQRFLQALKGKKTNPMSIVNTKLNQGR